jgi:cell division protein FtsN
VQIGAFTTKERAEKFAELSRTKIIKDIIITYSENNNLYLVQLSPFYTSRQEAELIRDELKIIPELSNVLWIVTVNK